MRRIADEADGQIAIGAANAAYPLVRLATHGRAGDKVATPRFSARAPASESSCSRARARSPAAATDSSSSILAAVAAAAAASSAATAAAAPANLKLGQGIPLHTAQ